MNLIIAHLYGDLMNTYGDDGNIIVLKKRCQWRKIEVEVRVKSLGSRIKKGEIDLYFFGGGQDQAQELVTKDLRRKGKVIKQDLEKGVPCLAICGGYQLLGECYKPHQGPKLEGLGILPVYTLASFDRMIGNLIIKLAETANNQLQTDPFLIGFENHSGKTYLKEGAKPLGKVIKGSGNNGEDKTEGCIYKNTIGCYMHGSLLPKNPDLADWLIEKALEIKYQKEINLEPLDDTLELSAHQKAVQMFR